jgi:hypothetical protein
MFFPNWWWLADAKIIMKKSEGPLTNEQHHTEIIIRTVSCLFTAANI